jgi:hypothetical protein
MYGANGTAVQESLLPAFPFQDFLASSLFRVRSFLICQVVVCKFTGNVTVQFAYAKSKSPNVWCTGTRGIEEHVACVQMLRFLPGLVPF